MNKKLLCIFVAVVTCVMTFAPISINATNYDELNFNDYATVDGGGSANITIENGLIKIRQDASYYAQSSITLGSWSTTAAKTVTNDKSYFHGTTLKDVKNNTKTQYSCKIKKTGYKTVYEYEVTFRPTLKGLMNGYKKKTVTYTSKTWKASPYYSITYKTIKRSESYYYYVWTQWADTKPSGTIVDTSTRILYQPVYTYYTWKQNFTWYKTYKKPDYNIKSSSILHWQFYPNVSDNQKLVGDALSDYGDNYISKIDEYYISSEVLLKDLDNRIKALAVDKEEIREILNDLIADKVDGFIIDKVEAEIAGLALENLVKSITKTKDILSDAYGVFEAEDHAKEIYLTLLKKIPYMDLLITLMKLSECYLTNRNVDQFRYYLAKAVASDSILGYQEITYLSGLKSVRFAVISNLSKVSFNAKDHTWFSYESFTNTGNYYGNVNYINISNSSYLFGLMEKQCEVKIAR